MKRFSRRDAFRYTLITGGAALAIRGDEGNKGPNVVTGNRLTSSSGLTSPTLTPWVDELPVVQTLEPLETTQPNEKEDCYKAASGAPCPFDVYETTGRDWWSRNKASSYPLVNGLAHQR